MRLTWSEVKQSVNMESAYTEMWPALCKLENVAIANALQLEVARATPALSRINYNTIYSEPIHCRIIAFCCWYITLRCDLDLWPLTLNICSVSPVTWWNSLPNLNTIERSAAELLRFHTDKRIDDMSELSTRYTISSTSWAGNGVTGARCNASVHNTWHVLECWV